ncbi:MAG: hypothetical protein Tsb0013_22280 [Phycisphaerales bacterium]
MSPRRSSALALVMLGVLALWSSSGLLVTHAPADVTHRVNVNTADADELTLLPRIGPSLSAAIVASREAEGRFREVDDLDRVPRIGMKTVEGLRPFVSVD